MILCDMKPTTEVWDKPTVEVCFTSKVIQREFTNLVNLSPSARYDCVIKEYSENPLNIFTEFHFKSPYIWVIIKDALAKMVEKYETEIMDY